MKGQPFDTEHHRCVFGDLGVELYNTQSLEEDEVPDVLLTLSYTEALEFARYLLAHEPELHARQVELETRFTQLSEALVALFEAEQVQSSQAWKQEVGFTPEGSLNFDQLLSAAYKSLKVQKATQVKHWYGEDEKRETDFWLAFQQFFYEHYCDALIEKFFPESEEEEEKSK